MTTSGERINYFAQTDYRGRQIKFGIKEADRARHMYVIGKTGMGKSTLLENLAVQDIQNGEGVCFIDPHGSSAELLLSYVPEHRINDVVYFAPFDQQFPVAMNVMEDIGADKRPLVASGLIGSFKKVWVDAWSPRMEYILNNALLALLEAPDSTLLGVNRMFADKAYREHVLTFVKDPSVLAFWKDEFAKYSDKFATEATAAIQNKVGQFAANPLIRNIVGQPKSTFDIRKLMDEKKIFIVNLSKGRIGEGNAALIGSMLVTKIYLAAMSRAEVHASQLAKLPPFYLYVDEFQSFANESFADILSEARKYKLSLTVAHQYIEQMSDEVRAAVFGNVGTMITFRVGSYDAEVLEKEFAPQFVAQDIVNLGFAQIYLKLMINNVGSQPFSATTLPRPELPSITYTQQVVDASRKQFGMTREAIEEQIRKWHEPIAGSVSDTPRTKKIPPGTRSSYAEDSRGNEQRKYPPRNDERNERPRPPERERPVFDKDALRAELMKATQGVVHADQGEHAKKGQDNIPLNTATDPIKVEPQQPINVVIPPQSVPLSPNNQVVEVRQNVGNLEKSETRTPLNIGEQSAQMKNVATDDAKEKAPQVRPVHQPFRAILSHGSVEKNVSSRDQAPGATVPPHRAQTHLTKTDERAQQHSDARLGEQRQSIRNQQQNFASSLKVLPKRDKGPSEQNLNVLKNALQAIAQRSQAKPERTIPSEVKQDPINQDRPNGAPKENGTSRESAHDRPQQSSELRPQRNDPETTQPTKHYERQNFRPETYRENEKQTVVQQKSERQTEYSHTANDLPEIPEDVLKKVLGID